MTRSEQEQQLTCDYARSYETGQLPAMLEIERSVLGGDYGGTSWTTLQEVDVMVAMLALGPDSRLLELGAGSGWPGIRLAELGGCDTVLVDIPLVGLELAAQRASRDGLATRCRAVAADGARLPFAGGVFDALSHSDVLCCTPAKREMLRECRRVARPGASMVFSVIAPAPSLSEFDQRDAVAMGPPFVDMPADYEVLLAEAAWTLEERRDVTPEYARSVGALIAAMEAKEATLIELLGAEDYDQRMSKRRRARAGIARHLLRRELFVARAG